MHITALKITKFRGIESLSLTALPKSVFIVGLNGKGKTCIHQALRFVFGFPVMDSNGDRIKNAELIGPKGDEAEIVVNLTIGDERFRATATIKKKGAAEYEFMQIHPEKRLLGKVDPARRMLFDKAQVDSRQLAVSMNPGAYLTKPQLGEALAGLVGGADIDPKALEAACGDFWGELLDHHDKDQVLTRTALLHHGEISYAERTKVNGQIKLLTRSVGELQECLEKYDAETLKAPVSALEASRQRLTSLGVERDKLVGEVAKAKDAGPVTSRDDADRIGAEAEAAGANYTAANEALVSLKEEIREAENRLSGIMKAQSQANASMSETSGKIKAVDKAKGLVFAERVCSQCGSKLTEKQINATVQPMKAEITRLEALYDGFTSREGESQEDVKSEKANIAAFKEKLEPAQDLVSSTKEQNSLCQQQAAKLDNAPAMPLEEAKAALDETEGRIAHGLEVIKCLETKQELAQIESQLKESLEEKLYLEWAVGAFKSGYILNELTTSGAGGFEEAVNNRLTLYGYSVKIEAEGKTVRMLFSKGGPYYPLAQASQGEITAVALAVCPELGKGGIVCVDNLNHLDGEKRNLAVKQIQIIAESCGSLWLSATYSAPGAADVDVIAKAIAPAKVVWMGEDVRVSG